MSGLEPESAPAILLAPGAGAGSSSPWMRAWRERLTAFGEVDAFDYPYRLAGRKAPDRLPILIDAHRAALEGARARHPNARGVVLAGKSMGGRVGCHLALEAEVSALICFGYPLVGARGAVRDEVLVALTTPVLFVQGTRDPLCPLELLTQVRKRMTAPSELWIVERGNHSLEVPRGRAVRSADPPEDPQLTSDALVLNAIAQFLSKVGSSL